MFRRKFGYESEDYPKFSDLVRDDDLDAQVHCTGYGFTKEMEEDLLQEYGMIEREEQQDDEENEEEAEPVDEHTESYTNDELAEYRTQLENEVKFSEDKPSAKLSDSIMRYIESCTQYLGNMRLGPEVEIPENMPLPETHANVTANTADVQAEFDLATKEQKTSEKEQSDSESDKHFSDARSISSNDLETEDIPELVNVDPNSRMYRLKMVEKLLNDTRSQRSYSTTASTIAPSVITDRIKRNLDAKEKREMRKRCVAKGEASAVHRHRKENKDVVKEYAGWDF